MSEERATLHHTHYVCGLCEDGVMTEPEWGCIDCSCDSTIAGVPLCDDCKDTHSKFRAFKEHTVLPINEYLEFLYNKTPIIKEKPIICLNHPLQEIEYFCDICCENICSKCFQNAHSGHRILTLKEGIKIERKKIAQICGEVEVKLQSLSQEEQVLKSQLSVFVSNKDNLHKQLTEDVDKFIAHLQLRLMEAHTEIDKYAAAETDLFLHKEVELKTRMHEARSTVDSATKTIEAGSDFEVLERAPSLHTCLQRSLDCCNPSVEDEQPPYALHATTSAIPNITRLLEDLHKTLDRGSLLTSSPQYPIPTSSPFAPPPSDPLPQPRKQKHKTNEINHKPVPRNNHDDIITSTPSNTNLPAIKDALPQTLGPGFLTRSPLLSHPWGIALSQQPYLLSVTSLVQSSSSVPSQPAPVACCVSLLYVADRNNHRVLAIDAVTGEVVRTLGNGHGAGPGQLDGPSGIALLQTHTVNSTCSCNGAVNSACTVSSIDACNDTVSSTLRRRSADVVYIADTNNHRVQVFNGWTGEYLLTIPAGSGSGSGGHRGLQLHAPWALALLAPSSSVPSASGDDLSARTVLFVADRYNPRVQLYDASTGQYLKAITLGASKIYPMPMPLPVLTVLPAVPAVHASVSGDLLSSVISRDSFKRSNKSKSVFNITGNSNSSVSSTISSTMSGTVSSTASASNTHGIVNRERNRFAMQRRDSTNNINTFSSIGNMYLTSTGSGASSTVSNGSTEVMALKSTYDNVCSGMTVSVQDSEILLFLSEYNSGYVKVFRVRSGELVHVIGFGNINAVTDGDNYSIDSRILRHPMGIAVLHPLPLDDTAAGHVHVHVVKVFVADFEGHCVQVFNAETGEHLSTIGGAGCSTAYSAVMDVEAPVPVPIGLGQLKHPCGLAIHRRADGKAVLFVSEWGNNRVQTFITE